MEISLESFKVDSGHTPPLLPSSKTVGSHFRGKVNCVLLSIFRYNQNGSLLFQRKLLDNALYVPYVVDSITFTIKKKKKAYYMSHCLGHGLA